MFLPESNSEELESEGTEQSKELDEGTDEQSEETQGAGEQSEDKNSTEVDVSKLPPELQKTYKSMQADYVKKTQAVAENRKSLEAKEKQLEELRSQYEKKLVDMTQPKSEDKPLIDESQMTAEQKEAWRTLQTWVKKEMDTTLSEREKTYKNEIASLKGQLGNFLWNDFKKSHSDADGVREKMVEINKQIGGNPSLEHLYILAKGEKALKDAGVEEYRKKMGVKKKVVTSKPTSTSASESEIEYEKGPINPNKRKAGILKAFSKAREELGIK